MSEPLRCFWAVRIPCFAAISDLIADLRRFGRTVRTVAPDDLHVTVKFLGSTPAAGIPDLVNHVRSAVASPSDATLHLRGVGAFPSPRRPNVIWVGFTNSDWLARIASECEAGCAALGFPPESRAFRPHLTLARVKGRPPAGLSGWIDGHSERPLGSIRASALELIQSDLRRTGPHYTTLARVPLEVE